MAKVRTDVLWFTDEYGCMAEQAVAVTDYENCVEIKQQGDEIVIPPADIDKLITLLRRAKKRAKSEE